MRKSFVILLLAFSGICRADNSLLIAGWKCNFESEYINAEQALTLNQDMTYNLTTIVFGSELVDIGKWSASGNQLMFNREFHIKDGKKENSNQEFSHTITKLDNSNLTFTNGKGTSSCTK